ncbi:MAG: type VI secretion system-associated protein TagF [Geminicoccaceae bacterium]
MIVGVLGKLPTNGDFVRRRVPAELAEPLDAWLAQALAASRDQLGEAWLPTYLTAPVWRFALAAGCCGPAAAGIWLPSVDKVGRYFPCLLVAELSGAPPPTALPWAAEPWYDHLEELALATLGDQLSLEQLEASLDELAAPELPEIAGGLPWRLPLAAEMLAPLAGLAPIGSLWWGRGSPAVPPSLLACAGLPPPDAFAAMLDGGFAGRGWTEPGP